MAGTRRRRVGRHCIQRWLRDGRLHRLHDGVYAVGHPGRSLHGDLMAAVLACGEGAVLSHRSAGHLLGLLGARPARSEVTVPTTAGRRRPGIVIHRVAPACSRCIASARHPDHDRAAGTARPGAEPAAEELPRACHEAWIGHRTSPHHVEACLARNPRKPGAAKLRRALGADLTLSALEDGFVELLERHRLPAARTNVAHAGDKVDCRWPEHQLTVELLSYRFHASRRSFEADVARRRRSKHLAFTYGDVFERAARTAAELAAALAG